MPDTEGFGDFTRDQAALIWAQLCPQASEDEVKYFLMQAQRRKLDPLAGQIKLSIRRSYNKDTQQWDSRAVIITGIDGFRTIAQRTGEYEGQLGPYFCGPDQKWSEVWTKKEPPFACKVGVWRKGFREPLWSVTLWSEYCPLTKDGKPQAMWGKMPTVMAGKVSEAVALRRAFPEDLGMMYAEEEMAQADNEPAPIRQPPRPTPTAPHKNAEEPVDCADQRPEDNPPSSAGSLPNAVSPLDDDAAYSNLLTIMTAGGKQMDGAPGLPPRFSTHYLDLWKADPETYPHKAKLFAAAKALAKSVQKLLVFDLNKMLEEMAVSRDEAKALLGIPHMTDLLQPDGTMPTIEHIRTRITDAIAYQQAQEEAKEN
jgi:phage recombination protein Bet